MLCENCKEVMLDEKLELIGQKRLTINSKSLLSDVVKVCAEVKLGFTEMRQKLSKKQKVFKEHMERAEATCYTHIHRCMMISSTVTFLEVLEDLDSENEQVFSDPNLKELGLVGENAKNLLGLQEMMRNFVSLKRHNALNDWASCGDAGLKAFNALSCDELKSALPKIAEEPDSNEDIANLCKIELDNFKAQREKAVLL